MIKSDTNKNIFTFLIIALSVIFTGGVIAAYSTAEAASIGKKKKGYTAKTAKTVKTAAKKNDKTPSTASTPSAASTASSNLNKAAAQVKSDAQAVLKEKNNSISAKTAKNSKKAAAVKTKTAREVEYADEYAAESIALASQQAENMAAETKKAAAPLKAIALSSNNYYESRYAELAAKTSEAKNLSTVKKTVIKSPSVKTSAAPKKAVKNMALSSNVVISSEDNQSYFNGGAQVKSKPASNQGYYKPAPPTYLSKNSKSKPAAANSKEDSNASGEAASNSKPWFFSKYLGNSESRLKWFPGLYLNLGANVLENPDTGYRKMWSKIGAIPRFSYNNISFSYDLTFYFDENNNLRKTDWDTFDDYIRKIYYVYYGKPGDRLSARVEMIDELTLGSGAIFKNYCGSLRYPLLDKKVGGVVTYNTGYDDHINFFVDDIASPGIYAASFEIMPHDHIQVGAQIVSDNKVNMGLRNENITVGSLHVGIPLSSKYNSKFKIYEEIAKIKNFGSGMHTGIIAETKEFTFKTEFRVMSSNYIPNYFDTLYEMERHYKGRSLVRLRDNGERYSGWFNEFKAKIADAYTFRFSYTKDYSPFLKPHLSLGVDYTGMEYNKLKISANYDRKNLYYSNSRVSDAIYGLKARYDISDSSSMCYELRHVLNDYGRAVDSINIETQLKF
jgi:hypothetical protein